MKTSSIRFRRSNHRDGIRSRASTPTAADRDAVATLRMRSAPTLVSPRTPLFAVAIVLCTTAPVVGQTLATGAPAKLLASCEIDLNGDKQADVVLALETVRGPEVIALLASGNTYRGFVIAKGARARMRLRCEFGDSVTSTTAGPGNPKPRTVRTPGAYIQLYEPESSSFAYVWTGMNFTEVATSD